jgi:uncharacterized membrane protein
MSWLVRNILHLTSFINPLGLLIMSEADGFYPERPLQTLRFLVIVPVGIFRSEILLRTYKQQVVESRAARLLVNVLTITHRLYSVSWRYSLFLLRQHATARLQSRLGGHTPISAQE